MALPPKTLGCWRAELDSGRVSSRGLTEQALDAAAGSSEAQSTFLTVHAATARATADAIDALRAAHVPLPLLAGIPVSVKDLFDETGQVKRGIAGTKPAGSGSGRQRHRATTARGSRGDHRAHQHD